MKDLIEVIKGGKKAFTNQLGKYPTHVRIGRKLFTNFIIEWEKQNRDDFVHFMRNYAGLQVEYDMRSHDTLELYYDDKFGLFVKTVC